MTLLKIAFVILFLLSSGFLAIGSVVALCDREFWIRPHKALMLSVILRAWITFALSLYSVLVDWSAVGYALAAYFSLWVAQWIVIAVASKEQGFGWRELRIEVAKAVKHFGIDRTIAQIVEPWKVRMPQNARHLRPAPSPRLWRNLSTSAGGKYVAGMTQLPILGLGIVLIWVGFFRLFSYAHWLQIEPRAPTVAEFAIALCAIVFGAWLRKRALTEFRAPLTLSANAKLRSVGLVLYATGFVGLLFGAARIILPFPGPYWTSTSYGIVFGVATALCECGLALIRRQVFPDAGLATETDTRRPILYLRSFSRESRKEAILQTLRRYIESYRIAVMLAKSVFEERRHPGAMKCAMKRALGRRAIFGRLTLANLLQTVGSHRGGLYDEQLVIANIMNRIGPYIAVARPTESANWRDVGAARLAVPDDKWEFVVKELVADSAIIVIEAGSSGGLLWEVQEVVRSAEPTKVLLIIPMTDWAWDEFRGRAGGMFPGGLPRERPVSRLMSFRQNWTPWVLGRVIVDIDEAFTRTSCEETLRPFFEQNGV
jgi:hypothetical protein